MSERKPWHKLRACRRCGTTHGVIKKYKLYYCRKCMREVAKELGFKKYQ